MRSIYPILPLSENDRTAKIGSLVIENVSNPKNGFAIKLTGGALEFSQNAQLNRSIETAILDSRAKSLLSPRAPISENDIAIAKDTTDTAFYRDMYTLFERKDRYFLFIKPDSYLKKYGNENIEKFIILSEDEYIEKKEVLDGLISSGNIEKYDLIDAYSKLSVEDRKTVYKTMIDHRNYKALRAINRPFSDNFDLVVVDFNNENEMGDIIFHPGNRRNVAYISRERMNLISKLYDDMDIKNRAEVLQLMWEALLHEDEHSIQFLDLAGSDFALTESDINRNASSFRVITFFRVLHSYELTGVKPNFENFFEKLYSTQRNRISYIHAYTELTLDQHIEIADILTRERPFPEEINGILAQEHLGLIFYNSIPGSQEFTKAIELLRERRLISKGQETGKVFPVYKFVRELIRQHSYIMMDKPVEESNLKATSLEQFESWHKGTEKEIGDSVYFPKADQTTAVPVNKTILSERIRAIHGLDPFIANKLIGLLNETADGNGTIIPKIVLDTVGNILLKQTSIGISAAGKGTRYAEIIYTDSERMVKDKAKGTYKIPMPISGEKSIIEILIAQIRHINHTQKTHMSLDLYTSHFTQTDIETELLQLGYKREEEYKDYRRAIFKHKDDISPDISIFRIRKTLILGGKTGDFYLNVVGSKNAVDMELQWPDAHDSTFLDFFVSGNAYSQLISGNKYRFISNIDNRAAMPNAVITALMVLTGSSLANEAPRSAGEPGGSLTKYKENALPSSLDFGIRKGILEGFEFAPGLF